MMSPTVVAVDLGGSRLRLVATQVKGNGVEWERKAVSPANLPAVLEHAWKKMGWIGVERLIVGSKGVWTLSERQVLHGQLKGLAKTVTVMSDIELALHGAFAPFPQKAQRVLLVAGTGSMALGLTKSGRLVRAGGLGPPKGDEGSGWWIGHKFLREQPRKVHKKIASRASVRQIANLAKNVIARATTDPVCSKIVQEAQAHLAQLVMDVSHKMKNRSPIRVSWGGSLLANETFRNGVLSILQKQFPHRFRFIPPGESPARAAAHSPNSIPSKTPRPIPPRAVR